MAGLRLCAAVSQHLEELIRSGWAVGAGLSPFQQAAREEARQKTRSQHLIDMQRVGSLAAAPAEVLLLLPEATPAVSELALENRNFTVWRA